MINVVFSETNTTFESEFSDENTSFRTEFSDGDNVFETDLEESPGGVSLDHRRLVGRNALDQHPIESITGLSSELETVPKESLSNIDLEKLLIY